MNWVGEGPYQMIPKKSLIPRAPLNITHVEVVPPQNEKIFPTIIFPFYRGLYIRCIGGLTHSTSKMINLNIRGFSLKCVF